MLKFAVGQKIYYRGDMANAEGRFVITDAIDDKWGKRYTMQEIGEREEPRTIRAINECMIDTKDTGNGMTRFCTQEAHEEWRQKQVEKMNEFLQGPKEKRLALA